MSQQQNTRLLALETAIMPLTKHKQLFNLLCQNLSKKNLRTLTNKALSLLNPHNPPQKIEKWFENEFTKNPKTTPRKAAALIIKKKRMSPKLTPMLIRTAQRVKDRITVRNKRRTRKTTEI